MLRPANVATPPAAATVVVPDSAPPPGLVPSATVTFAVNWVAVFPCASCAVTCTAGVIAVPTVVLDGWTLNTSCDATPGVILNGVASRSEEHTSELQSQFHLVCRLLLEKKKKDSGTLTVRVPFTRPGNS